MDATTAKEKFTLADQLYRQGHYEEALAVLSELNKEFPNTKNVMYPAALCMEKLGRIEEAKMLCHSLIRSFDSQKARELLNYLEVAPRVAVQTVPVPEAMVAPPVMTGKTAPVPSSGSNRNLYIIIGVVLGVALLVGLPFIFGRPETPSSGAPSSTENTVVFLVVLFGIGIYTVFCYLMKCICENAGSEPGALIWVAILQIIPTMRAADMSFWWLVAIFIPFVGGIIFTGVLWVKLCQACNKPAWLGILALLPLLNLGLIFYLAFSTPD